MIKVKQPYFSIVIPTFNRESELKRSINSVLNQTFEDWELHVVDDGSTDNTSVLMKTYVNNDSRIHFHKRDPNLVKGAPTVRNIGISKSKGLYVAFLDSDDEWKEIKLESDYAHLKNGTINALYSSVMIDEGSKKHKAQSRHIKSNETYADLIFSRENFAQTSVLVVKRKHLESIRFDPKMGRHDDLDFVIKVGNHCGWEYYDETLTTIYWQKGVTRLNSFDGLIAFYEKYKDSCKNPNNLACYLTWAWVCAARFDPSYKQFYQTELKKIFGNVKIKYKMFIIYPEFFFFGWNLLRGLIKINNQILSVTSRVYNSK